MKLFNLIAIVLAFSAFFFVFGFYGNAEGATFYVDKDKGDDQNNGLGQNSPWKTIGRLNKNQYKPGDIILLKKNQIWREKLVFQNSGTTSQPIKIGAYGDGARPILNGSMDVSDNSWIEVSHNIWATKLNQDDRREPGRMFINNKPVADSHLKQTQAELLAQGDWAWEDTGGGMLYIFSETSPVSWKTPVEVNVLRYGIYLGSESYIQIEGLQVSRSREGIWIGGSGCLISDCIANDNTFTGIHVTGNNNYFSKVQTLNNGVDVRPDKTEANGSGILVDGAGNKFTDFVSNDNSEDGVQTGPKAGDGNIFTNATMRRNRENCFDFKSGEQTINGGDLASDAVTSADCILVHKAPHHVYINGTKAISTTKGPALYVSGGASVSVSGVTFSSDFSSTIFIDATAGAESRIVNSTIGDGGKKSKAIIDIQGGTAHLIQNNTIVTSPGVEAIKIASAAKAILNQNKIIARQK